MQKIENSNVQETIYKETLSNGLTIMVMPKKDIQKKFVIISTNYGSVDNRFIPLEESEEIEVPDGVAHFLEHKLFEQPDGTNSLDTLTALGVNANAYTTNDHTAYLFECTDNFYEALDELTNYIQNPYFTDQNVEKEKGIISQEINMYNDYPEWIVYINAMNNMYKEHPVKKDITGTIETIKNITKETLYKCYNTFYNPTNMIAFICGDFNPEEIIKTMQDKMCTNNRNKENKPIERIYANEPEEIVKQKSVVKLETSLPLFVIGIKDKVNSKKLVEKHISVEILLNILVGKSSKLYKELYEEGLIQAEVSLEYEFSKDYAHILISGQSKNPEKVLEKLQYEIQYKIENGIKREEFERNKKVIYGDYIREYNDIADISRMFISDYFKGINSFEYLEKFDEVKLEKIQEILEQSFKKEKTTISIVM